MADGDALRALALRADAMPAEPSLQVVVMGVSGCGKSTVGAALAQALGLRFIEGDSLHPARNVALMAAGTPLSDDDRQGWLQAVAAALAGQGDGQGDGQGESDGEGTSDRKARRGVVVSCSALKRSYRDVLRARAPALRIVHLQGSPALLAARLQARSGHYMPPSLLQSQLDTLEPPAADEGAISGDIATDAATLVRQLVLRLQLAPH